MVVAPSNSLLRYVLAILPLRSMSEIFSIGLLLGPFPILIFTKGAVALSE